MREQNSKIFYGYIIVATSFIVMVLVSWSWTSYGIFFKPVAEEFGLSRAVTSGAYSVFLFVSGLIFLIAGRLTDRFGPRLVVTSCGIFLALGYYLMSMVNNAWQLYLSYGLVMAIGMGSGLLPTMSLVSRWFVKKRGLMTGIVVAGAGTGIVILPPIATQFISSYGWRFSYVILGIITLICITTAAQFLRRDPAKMGLYPYGSTGKEANKGISKSNEHSPREAIHSSKFWLLCAIFFCYGFYTQSTTVHIIPHVTDMGISAIYAAGILSVIGGISIAGRVLAGVAGDKFGNLKSIVIGFIMALASFVWLLFARELWMLVIFACIFGFSYGAIVALEIPTTAELFGLRAHGSILGAVHFSATSGVAVGSPLAGGIFDLTGSYQVAFIVFMGIVIIGITLTLLLKKQCRVRIVEISTIIEKN